MIEQVSLEEVFEHFEKNEPFRIIGLDTGLANVGWGVIEVTNEKSRIIDAGLITTKKKKGDMDLARRIYIIESTIEEVIQKHNPLIMAYEELFFNSKFPSTMKANLPVGALLSMGYKLGLRPLSFRPQDPKKMLTTNIKATKEEVAQAVASNLGLSILDLKDYKNHTTDALGIALCYRVLLEELWEEYSWEKHKKQQ